LASNVFIGENLSDEKEDVNNAFVNLVEASMVIVRYPILGNKYQKGLEGRAFLESYFGSRVEGKQVSQDTDMFAEISRAQSDDGEGFSRQDIVDRVFVLPLRKTHSGKRKSVMKLTNTVVIVCYTQICLLLMLQV